MVRDTSLKDKDHTQGMWGIYRFKLKLNRDKKNNNLKKKEVITQNKNNS